MAAKLVCMSTADPIAEVNAAMDACVTAQEAGDYRTALAKAHTARYRMAQIPDSEFATERLTWSRQAVKEIVDDLLKATQSQGGTSAAGGRGALIRPIDIVYTRDRAAHRCSAP